MATPDLDIRLYSKSGQRLRLPPDWVQSVDFEIGERGGALTGTLSLLVGWTELPLVGNEYVDIRLWGTLLYRGYVRGPSQEIAVPEKAAIRLHGLMELLNGFQVPRDVFYGSPVGIETAFTDLVAMCVTTPTRMPSLVVDTTGVAALSITVQQILTARKTFSQAMNALCDAAPNQVIWGCDTDGSGANRLYLRPRSATVAYKFAVGDKISAFTYPRDATQIVNILHVEGGKLAQTNGAPNAAFEETVLPGELTTNMLANPSFDSPSAGTTPDVWLRNFSPPRTNIAPHNGTYALLMDNTTGTSEAVYQDMGIVTLAKCHASVWAREQTIGGGIGFRITIYAKDSSGSVIGTGTSALLTPNINGNYEHFQFDYDFGALAGVTAVTMWIQVSNAATTGNGVQFDDAAFWMDNVTLKGWRIGTNLTAHFTTLDVASLDVTPFFGGSTIKMQGVIDSGGGYMEFCTTESDRPSVEKNTDYTLIVRAQSGGAGPVVSIGGRLYNDKVLASTVESSHFTVPNDSAWHAVTAFHVRTDANTTSMEIFIRLYNGDLVYLDAVTMTSLAVPVDYYPADTYRATRRTDDYSGGDIGTEAATSIDDWGEREKTESVESILDVATMEAYAKGYFRAHAVPTVQASLSIMGADAPVNLDGTVMVENLPSLTSPLDGVTPAAVGLFPSKVKYSVKDSADIIIDLNNEVPDMALLLRRVSTGQA
jgi:hypothetical protein